ncbi:MAG TPA: glutaredoxin family protein [Syntrophales bacterium]|nr:glutaredoxin family protein [Syntrophales bacterium]HOX94804.1 glutaredoxin family protein [Syntrophales bacterium]HPI57954.1 glutaredoxin family protein [Syntrophales bacterium]HPN24567.1 glutaredoxin family protein [Syntrophales bacterium]HQM28873.1 glutaredoxin family protein [Syntrophales bacterium]
MKNNPVKYMMYLSAFLFAILSYQAIAHATLYKWVDEKGVLHMTDTPPDAATARKYVVEKTGADESGTAQAAEKKDVKPSRHEVVIYTTPTCPYCKYAKEFLSQKGVFYTEKDVSADPAAKDEMMALTGKDAVPVIVIDGEPIVGFNAQKIEEKLGLVKK